MRHARPSNELLLKLRRKIDINHGGHHLASCSCVFPLCARSSIILAPYRGKTTIGKTLSCLCMDEVCLPDMILGFSPLVYYQV